MKKLVNMLVMIIVVLVVTACSGTEKSNDDTPKMLNVDLIITPEKAQPNELITFQAKVTYGDEEVTDADTVTFEIWRSKDKNHEKIDIKHSKDGIYQLEKSFATEGTYYIYSHVTARDMHNMPKKEFTVGEPSEPEDSKADGMEMNEEGDSGTENDHVSH